MKELWIHDPRKDREWKKYRLRVALGFPDEYRAGMANLGFLWVQHLFNIDPEVRCDRFFADNRQLNRNGRMTTLETGRAIDEYDVIAFSVPYESGYARIPWLLMLGGVTPLAERRSRGPIVIAGGMAVSANPEPVADFIDAVVVGEAEPVFPVITEILKSEAVRSGSNRIAFSETLRAELRRTPGIYVSSDYEPRHGANGEIEAIDRKSGAVERVRAQVCERIITPAHSTVISDRSAFPDRFLIEASRGCPYRCRFCMASHTSGSWRPAEGVAETVAAGLEHTKKVGVIGTAFARSPELADVCRNVAQAGGSVSFSSIRIDASAMKLFERAGDALDLESIAVAPEVATERLAKVIGKNLSKDLAAFADAAPLKKLRTLRMYFMIGVPGEQDSDIRSISELTASIKKKTDWKVFVSATPMIPKPFTPMQWALPAPMTEVKRRAALLKELLKRERIELKFESARESAAQAVLSTGDRRLSAVLLEEAVASERDVTDPWRGVVSRLSKRNMARQTGFPPEAILPWDVIDHGCSKESLYAEYSKAVRAAEETNE